MALLVGLASGATGTKMPGTSLRYLKVGPSCIKYFTLLRRVRYFRYFGYLYVR